MDRRLLEAKREAQNLREMKLIDDFELDPHDPPRIRLYIEGRQYCLRVCMHPRAIYSNKIMRKQMIKIVYNVRGQSGKSKSEITQFDCAKVRRARSRAEEAKGLLRAG